MARGSPKHGLLTGRPIHPPVSTPTIPFCDVQTRERTSNPPPPNAATTTSAQRRTRRRTGWAPCKRRTLRPPLYGRLYTSSARMSIHPSLHPSIHHHPSIHLCILHAPSIADIAPANQPAAIASRRRRRLVIGAFAHPSLLHVGMVHMTPTRTDCVDNRAVRT